jgi:hypothetical protein
MGMGYGGLIHGGFRWNRVGSYPSLHVQGIRKERGHTEDIRSPQDIRIESKDGGISGAEYFIFASSAQSFLIF